MFNLYSSMNRRGTVDDKTQPKELETTGHDRFCQIRPSRSSYRKKRKRNVRRAQSAAEFDPRALSAANKRTLFKGRSVSSEQENSESEQTEKSPLVSAKLETFAKMLFNRSATASLDISTGGVPKESSSSPTRSFFQSVCVLGYCLAPVAGALIVCKVLLITTQTSLVFFLRLVATLVGFLWASYAAYIFLGDSQPPNRKPLAVYPIVFFYFILSWLVISHSTI